MFRIPTLLEMQNHPTKVKKLVVMVSKRVMVEPSKKTNGFKELPKRPLRMPRSGLKRLSTFTITWAPNLFDWAFMTALEVATVA
jgi:hypothetical protein